MSVLPKTRWSSLGISAKELRCDVTLENGQCFGWKKNGKFKWTGVIGRNIFALKQTPKDTLYRVLNEPQESPKAVLQKYFNLNVNLDKLYKSWSRSDERFGKLAPYLEGVRLISQNPVECTFSFICSSNNNIPRITKMLSALRSNYGEELKLCSDLDHQAEEKGHYYSFPTVERLSKVKEQSLRDLGFGYRAKYIVSTAKSLHQHNSDGVDWLENLRTHSPSEIRSELSSLTGIGSKVADCIALFSLDSFSSVPVDTHVLQIAIRDYKFPKPNSKTLTKKVYSNVASVFTSIFGDHAGWAHSVLFTAELPNFTSRLPEDLRSIKSRTLPTAQMSTSKRKTDTTQGKMLDEKKSSKKKLKIESTSNTVNKRTSKSSTSQLLRRSKRIKATDSRY